MKPEKKAISRKPAPASVSKTPSKSTGRRVPRGARVGGEKGRELEAKQKSSAQAEVQTPGPSVAEKQDLRVPPLLLEGDPPVLPAPSAPGIRNPLGPAIPPVSYVGLTVAAGELPEAYGTEKLLVAARDPHWLYAHWDLTREQLRDYSRRSADGHLILRAFIDNVAHEPVAEVHVHPESRNWFIHVGRGGTEFVVELGYYAKSDRRWTRISVSAPALTPPDSLSADTSANFATIPIDVPFEQLLAMVKSAVGENAPLAEAVLQLRAQGHEGLPGPKEIESGSWTTAQESALAQLLSIDQVRRVWIRSLEVTELARRRLSQELASAAPAQFSVSEQPGARAEGSVSSPFGGVEGRIGFWFNVNADLVIYGATEPDATVTIGGRKIPLRPDGSFSLRFALPDGQYNLVVVAVSSDRTDGRQAELQFSRATRYRGEVGAHPQDPQLGAPGPENEVQRAG